MTVYEKGILSDFSDLVYLHVIEISYILYMPVQLQLSVVLTA